VSIRALMVDVDGVVVRRADGRRWDADIEADLGVRAEDLQRGFFQVHFADVVHGRAPLRERLSVALAEIAPHLTAEGVTDYWFAKDGELDGVLLDDLAALRAKSRLRMDLATVQEHERATYLWTTLGLRERFDAIHYAADLGCAKPDPAFFAAVVERTGFAPGELLLIDDSQRNVDGARAAGWQAALWTGEARLAAVLAPFGLAQ
jgi:putative hydrolase of the HAD superfamily